VALDDDVHDAAARNIRTRFQRVLIVLGVIGLVVTVFALVLRQFSLTVQPVMALAAFSPYLMLGAPIALLASALARSWIPAVAAAALLLVCLATQARLYVAQTAPAHAQHLVLMTSNLRLGLADPNSVVAQVREHHVDVLTTQELTDVEASRLVSAGLENLLPYSALAPSVGGTGVGIWSRYPLSQISRPTGLAFRLVDASVAVPGLAKPPTVVAVHMAGPWPNATDWSHDIVKLPGFLRQFAAANPNGAVLVGGDYNSTPDTAQFRDLLTSGYRDGADQAGAGMTRTYPSDKFLPPLIAIDHVLTRNAVATSARTLTVKGSDHRALLTTIALPMG
jgi:endonuclease/exonuclease/phosphatase (EEP) superfamily protein YafD